MVAVEKRMVTIKIAGFDLCIILCMQVSSFCINTIYRDINSPMTEYISPNFFLYMYVKGAFMIKRSYPYLANAHR